MRERIEAVTLSGGTLAVRAHLPPEIDHAMVTVATALHAFARYPVLRRLSFTASGVDRSVSREQMDGWLAPERLTAGASPDTLARLQARALDALQTPLQG